MVTIALKREYEIVGSDNNNDPCIFPRDISNHVWVQAANLRTKNIDERPDIYLAFPFFLKIGGSIVGIYSDGDSHANSQRQIIARSDDGGLTFTTDVFFENSSGVYDLSLLEGLLGEGQSVVLKAWTVKRIGGVLSVSTMSQVSHGGLNYALWSRAVGASGGKLYRTGYATSGSSSQTALFESTDGGVTWSFKSTVFAEAGKAFNEADIVNIGGTNWLAVCREDSGSGNPVYASKSTDDGVTWSAPSVLSVNGISGRQPNLIRTTDGAVLLALGVRTGSSGYTTSGLPTSPMFGTTGIGIWRTDDSGTTWGFKTRVSPMFSTDGGQPQMIEISQNRVFCAFYVRRGVEEKPIISIVSLDTVVL